MKNFILLAVSSILLVDLFPTHCGHNVDLSRAINLNGVSFNNVDASSLGAAQVRQSDRRGRGLGENPKDEEGDAKGKKKGKKGQPKNPDEKNLKQPADGPAPPADGPAPPADGPAPPADGPAPPADGPAPPADGPAPPAGGQAPPADGPAPPAGGQAPPADGPAPPADGPAPPAGGQAPPAGGQAPPADGPAPPAGGPAPPAEGPAPPAQNPGGPAQKPGGPAQKPGGPARNAGEGAGNAGGDNAPDEKVVKDYLDRVKSNLTTEWSVCSVSCGQGVRVRRKVGASNKKPEELTLDDLEVEICKMEKCASIFNVVSNSLGVVILLVLALFN
uniref:Circumsporozoite protein n=1 Tax=Plasmodium sp. PCSD-2013 TaxID=1343113 RepID=R9UH08_9APIC|nr:circumsporozoite protein A2 [Plasmodium sp. PCSD-2013]AGN53891.1 circumsporozoite protein B1 [Plasmodium sp. PCSD-2013]